MTRPLEDDAGELGVEPYCPWCTDGEDADPDECCGNPGCHPDAVETAKLDPGDPADAAELTRRARDAETFNPAEPMTDAERAELHADARAWQRGQLNPPTHKA